MNKRLLIPIIVLIVIGGLVLFGWLNSKNKQEIIESIQEFNALMDIKEIHLRGWDNEHPRWELFARNAQLKNQRRANLYQIYNGRIYNNGRRVIVDNIHSSTANVRLDRRNVLMSDVSATMYAVEQDIRKPAYVEAQRLSYENRGKELLLKDGVVITHDESVIHSELSRVYSESNRVEFPEGFRFNRKDMKVRGDLLTYDLDADLLTMKGNLKITRKETDGDLDSLISQFNLSCRELSYRTKQKEIFRFSGNIKIWRGGEFIKGEQGEYNDGLQRLSISRNVIMHFNPQKPWSGQTAADSESIHQITASHADIYFKHQEMMLTGPLLYEQPDATISAQQGWFDMDKDLLFLSGDVIIRKGDQVLKADKVDINVNEKSFEARGGISTQITI